MASNDKQNNKYVGEERRKPKNQKRRRRPRLLSTKLKWEHLQKIAEKEKQKL